MRGRPCHCSFIRIRDNILGLKYLCLVVSKSLSDAGVLGRFQLSGYNGRLGRTGVSAGALIRLHPRTSSFYSRIYPVAVLTEASVTESLGKHLEEKHMTWARFGKKRDKNATLQVFDQVMVSQSVETASSFLSDAIMVNQTVSPRHATTSR
ncbi:hypothetical protein Tco_0245322 [Tanacetum coccineum]